MSKLGYYIRRFRVNRGFTVHSPFAFRFIKLVVRERLPFYAFQNITDPYERLLYRTAVYFHPAYISASGPGAPRALEILRKALPDAELTSPDRSEFHFGDSPIPGPAIQFLQGRHSLPALTTFNLPRATIAISRPGLPPASYPLSLP
ncbi:MAG: hypothetical protein HDR86_07575 [Bacteroides sp.]|nr:hypothetical protein [Bacteroides sp.]